MIDQHQAIIEYPLRPLRVAAGAGTGKTTTMARRLAYLVGHHGIEPEQALGITFTNKAAAELAESLRRHLESPEVGRDVDVATYHGFAKRVLDEFGAAVGIERDAPLLTPGYARQMLYDALGASSCRHLDLTAASHRIEELATLAAQLGDNLVAPGELLAASAGDEEVPAQRRELAAVLERYATMKQAIGAVDYADLVAGAHRIVTIYPDIAAEIRSRYRVVLLDEYQDTNPAQRLLLTAIFGSGFPVTAVGDPNQTIYEWRGASLENFASFPEHFPEKDGTPAATLPLSTNYRSDHRILVAANAVQAEVGGDALPLAPRDRAGRGWVGTAWLITAEAEAAWIAGEIRRLHDEEGCAWRDMAVLFRKNADIGTVRDALAAVAVPIEVAAVGGLLSTPPVNDLHAWLRVLGRGDDAMAVARLLLRGPYRLGMADVAPLTRWARDRHGADEDDEAPGWALIEAIDMVAEIPGLSAEAAARLTAFRARYRSLLEAAQSTSLVELCLRVLHDAGIWQEVEVLDGAAALSGRLNLYRFLDIAESWSPLEGRPSLTAFLHHLDLLGEEGAATELDPARLSGEDAVALLTVHRAKGLEWDTVFLPAIADKVFPSSSRRFDDPVSSPQSLPYELRIDAERYPSLPPGDAAARRAVLRPGHDTQEWRTAYVAVTRARHRLYLTGATWYRANTTPKDPSPLFRLIDGLEATQSLRRDEPGERPEPVVAHTVPTPDPHFGEGPWEALRSQLANPSWAAAHAERLGVAHSYHAEVDQLRIQLGELPAAAPPEPAPLQTSVTGLVTFATCPLQFRYREVDPLPRRPDPALQRGIELHRRIELHNLGKVPLVEDLDGFYDIDSGEEVEGGDDAFTAFQDSRFAASRPALVEVPFNLKLAAGRVRGRIDAVYVDHGGSWEIVDFKSGRPRDDDARRVQLQAYAVAAEEVPFAGDAPRAITVTFAYFGGGRSEEISEHVDTGWMASARARLDELMEGIASGAYPPTPSAACRRCDFANACPAGTAWLAEHG